MSALRVEERFCEEMPRDGLATIGCLAFTLPLVQACLPPTRGSTPGIKRISAVQRSLEENDVVYDVVLGFLYLVRFTAEIRVVAGRCVSGSCRDLGRWRRSAPCQSDRRQTHSRRSVLHLTVQRRSLYRKGGVI
jgi:hypothetical protein